MRTRECCRGPAAPNAVDGRDQGELLVHDAAGVYTVRVHASRGHGQYIVPGTRAYQVVATERAQGPVARPDSKGKLDTTKRPRGRKTRWSLPVPVRVTAMAVAGERLFLSCVDGTLLCFGRR